MPPRAPASAVRRLALAAGIRRAVGMAAVLVLAFGVGLPAGPAAGQTGGAGMPGVTGGQEYGQPTAPSLRVARFAVAPRVLRAGGRTARFSYRVAGPSGRARVWIELRRPGERRVLARVGLGRRRLGRAHEHRWRPTLAALPPGRYVARLRAAAVAPRRGRATSRASGLRVLPRPRPQAVPRQVPAPAPPPAPAAPAPRPPTAPPAPPATPPSASRGVFPVQGAHSLGGADGRFGAVRSGYAHRGQDIAAAAGVPIVAPRAGVVRWRDHQPSGAGHYVVLRGDDGRDYVFMHMRDGSVVVAKGARVEAGGRIGEVGSSGHSSGPHLHFEIWPDGWLATGSTPIDPLPELLAWAAASPGA